MCKNPVRLRPESNLTLSKKFQRNRRLQNDQQRESRRTQIWLLILCRTGLLLILSCIVPHLLYSATTPALSAITCTPASTTGWVEEACTVTLTSAASSGGLSVSLTSSNTAVTLPATVTVAAGASSAGFTAIVDWWNQTAQAVTLTASAASVSKSFTLQLLAATRILTINATSVAFGNVTVNTPSTQTLTLSSTGNLPLTINAPTLTGTGFTASTSSFPVTLNPGQAATLSVQFDPSSAGAVTGQLTVTSNNNGINGTTATVSLSGTGVQTATQLSAFTCTSSSMTGSGTDACTVTLSAAAGSGGTSVSLSSSNTAVTLPATVTVPSGATSASFTAAVSACGTAQATTLTASAGGIAKSFALQLNAAVPALSVATSSSSSTYGSAVIFTATISSGPTGSVTFYDSGASIGTGTISGTSAALTTSLLCAGSHAITASWAGNSSYSAATSGAISQLVNKATPAVSWPTPTAISYGTALSGTQLDASSTVAGTFTYSPAAGTVLTAGSHIITATFTPTDSTDYSSATSTVSLTVNGVVPTITWATPTAISYGTALSGTQLDASSTVAGTFSYSPVAGTILTAGSHIITATFTPTDTSDYATTTSTISLTVSVATPVITWATPVAITYGTALSSTQLDASSTVAGTFTYSPAAGTILAVGSQVLSATFTPTDTTDYATLTQTVTLAINAATSTLSINATNMAFGDVNVNSPSTQTLTLTSTGTGAVTVSAVTLTGTGFTVSEATFPKTLSSGQAVTLSVVFDPTVAGAATGQLTVTSNSSTNGTAVIALTGTGEAVSYTVNLTWDAPSESTDLVAGYNVYRSPTGGSSYKLLNSSVETQTAYVDSTVSAGSSYDYIVESVDSSGDQSIPSNMFAATIP